MTAAAPPPPPPPASLLSRIPRELARKARMAVLLIPLFNLCYFLPQWLTLFPRRRIPLTPLDRAISFEPAWVYPYLSMYLMLPLPTLIATSAGQLRRYTVGLTLMFVSACILFLLFPIEFDRPPLPASAPPLYRLITVIDEPINSLPSLHAGLTVYTLLFARRILTDLPPCRRRALLTAGWAWAALILYGTLATKQHYALDLPPGALLAWVAHRIAWRGAAATSPTVMDNKGSAHAREGATYATTAVD